MTRFVHRIALHCLLAVSALLAGTGCAAVEPYDYGPYLAHMPRSIVVLPPLNETVEPLAPYNYLSTVTAPLAERGYYVFPVAMVDQMLKDNGLPTPAEMHTADLSKLHSVLGADAVLYLKITGWGTSYRVIDSNTTVAAAGRLVDARTGTVIWAGNHVAQQSSSEGQSNAVAMLVTALVAQIARTETDHAHDLAGPATVQWLWNEHRGLLLGPRHPGHAEQVQKVRQTRAK